MTLPVFFLLSRMVAHHIANYKCHTGGKDKFVSGWQAVPSVRQGSQPGRCFRDRCCVQVVFCRAGFLDSTELGRTTAWRSCGGCDPSILQLRCATLAGSCLEFAFPFGLLCLFCLCPRCPVLLAATACGSRKTDLPAKQSSCLSCHRRHQSSLDLISHGKG